jgi:hypothetical protein
VVEEIEGDTDVDPAERADRPYWEKKATAEFLAIVDKIVTALRRTGVEPRLTYNRHHIAMGTTGYNFCWFHPRKLAGNCHIDCRVSSETRDQAVTELQNSGIDASPYRTENINFSINAKALEAHEAVLLNVLKRAEEWSNR